MRSVTYSMGVSLDGYIVGPDGGFDWTAPDGEVFRFWIDEIREVGVHLMGRRLYETMLYWETADQDPSLDDSMLEWAALWTSLPKVVFSTTLSAVQGTAYLASGGLAEEIERLRAEQKALGKLIPQAQGEEKIELLARTKTLAADVKAAELTQTEAEQHWREAIFEIPNPAADESPATSRRNSTEPEEPVRQEEQEDDVGLVMKKLKDMA